MPNTATGDHGHALNRLRVVGVRAGLSLPLRELRSLQVRQTVPIPTVGWVLKDEDSNLRQYLFVGSVGEELERLDRLLANRDITKGEYESLKAELLQWVRSGNSEADSQEIAAPDLTAGSVSDSWRFRHWFLNALIDLGLLTAIVLTTTIWIPQELLSGWRYVGLSDLSVDELVWILPILVGATTVWVVRWRHGGKPAEGVPAHRQLDILVGSVVGTVGLAVCLDATLVRFGEWVTGGQHFQPWDRQWVAYSRRDLVAEDLLGLVTYGFVWWWYWWRNARRTIHLFTVKRFRLAVYGVLVLAPVGGAVYEYFS